MADVSESPSPSQAPEWEYTKECVKCLKPFTMMRRVHHCRGCGRCFCDEDSSKRYELPPSFKQVGKQRVCDECYYLLVQQSVETNPDLHPPKPDANAAKDSTIKIVERILKEPEDTWHLRVERKSVRIYTKRQSGSSVHTVKTMSVVPAPIEKVWYIYNEKDLWSNWQPDLKECRTIERVNENEEFLHVVFNLPVLDNRDVVFYNAILPGTFTNPTLPRAYHLLGCSVKHPLCPPTKGIVRAEMQYSMTTFEPLIEADGSEATRVVTIIHIDIRGLVPPVIINQAVSQGASTVVAMIDFMKRYEVPPGAIGAGSAGPAAGGASASSSTNDGTVLV